MPEILATLGTVETDAPALVRGEEYIEILASLSLAADAANGVPEETSLRTAVVAYFLAGTSGSTARVRNAAWFASLLRFLGCTAFAHEEYQAFGHDDVDVRRQFYGVDYQRVRDVLPAAWNALGERPWRLARMGGMLATASKMRSALAGSACSVGERLAERLEMPSETRVALAQLHERWDGRGNPTGAAEGDLGEATRLLHAACVVEATHRIHGPNAVLDEVERRRGGHLDPDLVDAVAAGWSAIAGALGRPSAWDVALRCLPSSVPCVSIGRICEVFADFVDLKLPHALGHGRAVARLSSRVARELGLDDDAARRIEVAGLVHNLGHVGIGNHVWESQSDWTRAQRQLMERHPLIGAQALARADAFREIRPLVVQHHERGDGSGYPGGLTMRALPIEVRILSAADVAVALCQSRPHRGRLGETRAEEVLEAEGAAGRLDPRVVAAVLSVSGGSTRTPPDHLSAREVEVLERLTLGESNKDIARVLGISAKTVQHHVRSIYQKAGVASRAAAALWAVECGYF